MHIIPETLETLSEETTFLLPGPAGDLEVLLSPAPADFLANQRFALICHPHPLYGGAMHNKVVTTLAKVFQALQMQTVRFNFRGVGHSCGTFAHGEGEQEDLLAIYRWLQQKRPAASFWLAGFSFGAYVSINVATQLTCAGLVSIAPPVNRFYFKTTPLIEVPWIVAQGENDEVVPFEAVLAWLKTLPNKPQLLTFPETGHFFHGQLTALKTTLVAALSEQLGS